MSRSISVHVLPALDGDCILLQAETDGALLASILIDGGRAGAYVRWKPIVDRLVATRPVLDLVVVTHLDADHIGGIVALLEDEKRSLTIGEVWFNGRDQVEAALLVQAEQEAFSVKQADRLSQVIRSLSIPMNASLGSGPVHSEISDPRAKIGPFEISVLTPSRTKLAAMSGPWEAALQAVADQSRAAPNGLEKLGTSTIDVRSLAAAPDVADTAKPNGSSIGLLIKAFGRKLLFAGDCHPDDMSSALDRIRADDTPLELDIFKVSHHGGRTSTSKAVLSRLVADIYAFSTDSSHRDHPDDTVVAKVLTSTSSPKILAFNYRTKLTEMWHNSELEDEFGYSTYYPNPSEEGYLRLKFDEDAEPKPPKGEE